MKETPDYYGQSRPEIRRFIPTNIKTILDVGTGEAYFLKSVKEELLAETWGVEVSEEVAQKAQQNADKILIGKLEDIITYLPNNYFDCITFNDVLEHILEPANTLNLIKSKLKEEGIIIASIPNVRYFFNLRDLIVKKDWRYTDAGILDSTHFRFFTQKSMARLFVESGYTIQNLEGINGIKSWKFSLFNIFTFGFFKDTRYLQFLCIAKKR